MPVAFTVKEVADNYTPLVDADHAVHHAGVYSGPLSNISVEMAEKMVATGCNLLEEKKKTAGAIKPGAEKEKPTDSK